MAKLFENKVFQDAAAAREWLEARLWPDGPVCPHCGVVGEAKALSKPPGTYQCNVKECRKQFTVTVGTVFERSHIPLNKWLMATFLFCASKKGVSAHQMHRLLGVTYKSAWFMMHRLREAVTPAAGTPPLGGKGKVVEADETYIGKKDGKRKHPGSGGYAHKRTVLSLTERGGKIHSFKIGNNRASEIVPHIRANVDPASILHTDGAQAYRFTGAVAAHESGGPFRQAVRPQRQARPQGPHQ